MDSPRNYTEKCTQLSEKVRMVLLELTSTTDVLSACDLLTENIRRWSELLTTLVEGIHQKGGFLGGSHEVNRADAVFLVLASGIDETISWLYDVLLVEEPSHKRRILSIDSMHALYSTRSLWL
jgi:hypothetical protein